MVAFIDCERGWSQVLQAVFQFWENRHYTFTFEDFYAPAESDDFISRRIASAGIVDLLGQSISFTQNQKLLGHVLTCTSFFWEGGSLDTTPPPLEIRTVSFSPQSGIANATIGTQF